MTNLLTLLVGPLVAPECRRSASRGWVFLTRTLAGMAVALFVLLSLSWWMLNQEYDAFYLPDVLVPGTAFVVELMPVVLAMLLAPAVLAGSLAGEKERGSIGLLLSTRVDSREIVLGRVFGKLSSVGSLLLACLPFQIAFAVLCDLSFASQLAMILLPAAVAFGAGGLAVAASAVARRGRNALMAVYFVELFLLLAMAVSVAPSLAWTSDFLGVANPLFGIRPLVRLSRPAAAFATIGIWTALGIGGIAFASWRLRTSYLRLVDGKKERTRTRRRPIPDVPDLTPMVWKERYIERVTALGWFGRLLNWLFVAYLVLGSLGMAASAFYDATWGGVSNAYDRTATDLARMFVAPAPLICILIQLSAGLRAAVAISSERERGTWDGLLTSPLSGREILSGKLRGSLFSLIPLLLAAVFAWIVCLMFGAMELVEFVAYLGYVSVGVIFVVAVGVRASLATQTATRAMTTTVAILLVAYAALAVVATLILGVVFIVAIITWVLLSQLGILMPNSRPGFPGWTGDAVWHGSLLLGFLILAMMIVAEARLRFDQLAGRMVSEGGERPMAPVYEKDEHPPSDPLQRDDAYRGSPAVGSASP